MSNFPFLHQAGARGGLEPLFDAMLEGVIVRDGEGRLLASNSAAHRILGLPRGVLQQHDIQSLPVSYLREDGSPFPAHLHPALVTLRSGQPQRKVVMGVVQGDREPVWVLVNSQPMRDASGRIEAVVTTFADITGMKHAESALRATEARGRTLAEAIAQSGSAVIITDRDGCIEYVNPACCAAYGYSEQELIGASPRLFKSGETPTEVYAALWSTILAGQSWRGELSNRSRDGRLIRETVSVSPVRDERGVVRHFVAVKEDITQLREDERRRHELFERVARLERVELVSTLTSGIAHDFNNILAAILGYSQLAETQIRADGRLPQVARHLEEIRTAGQRARELIQQLPGFRQTGSSSGRSTRLDGLAREVAGLLRATLPDTVALVTDIDPALPSLSVDPGHVHQLLMNLLVNARDAINGSGTVRLSARRESVTALAACDSCRCELAGDWVAISVSDDGPGIAPELRARLFEPFFTTKNIGQGTGIGLSVVHSVAHLYQGHVRVVSAPGAGCEIRVLLPASILVGESVAGTREMYEGADLGRPAGADADCGARWTFLSAGPAASRA
ncbi:PAS domain S-box protein [Aromatoleum sp.]|uniref:PAS domain S-box protein n=1 Tax=Aromatoleum sp. TaxID=2307007 RepID=UPI002FC67640